ILEVDGEKIYAFQDLRRVIDPHPGRPLAFVVDRGGEQVRLTVTPTPVEESDPIETQLVGKIGIAPNPAAPVIGVFDPEGAAYEAGLRSLDRVVRVGGAPV